MNSPYPHSAISSWGGFVYQGKVALFHAVKLLADGSFNGSKLDSFELQLDSTDDFAIYENNVALSVHQVKGKCSEYRSTFTTALGKSANISFDCTSSTERYFHIANSIDDASDYNDSKGHIVKFYKYETECYCPLSEIEPKTKVQIEKYLTVRGLAATPTLIESKYSSLSALISRQVIKCHSLIHTGIPENTVAYSERIDSSKIKIILDTDFHNLPDEEYRYFRLKKVFADTFETSIENGLLGYTAPQVSVFESVFRYVYAMDNAQLKPLIESFLPADKGELLRKSDVEIYSEIITKITNQVILKGLPHFAKQTQRYLPTAISIRDTQIARFTADLLQHIRSNDTLANVLFEYSVLIGFCKDVAIQASSDKITSISDNKTTKLNNIVKEFPVSIVSLEKAITELNA